MLCTKVRHVVVLWFVCLFASRWCTCAVAQDDAVQKVAFLAGVAKYEKDGLADLTYCEDDMRALADELRKQGFQVTLLLGRDATRARLGKDLDQFVTGLQKLKKNDVALIAFSGHGLQLLVPQNGRLVEDAFFCPFDALKTAPATLLSISHVMRQLEDSSGSSQNLLLIDACRDNPGKGAKSIDGSTATQLPNKISVLFGSSAGQRSFESDKVKQGVFTHVLLQGLRGQAPRNSRDEITWLTLASYVIDEVPLQVPTLMNDPGAVQRPNLMNNLVRQPVLARIDVRPLVRPGLLRAPFASTEAAQAQRAWADYLKVPERVTDQAGVSLVLIPPGEFTMGSPTAEKDRDTDETQHQVRITQPFYLAAHEVTVGQFRQFVSETGYKTEAETDGQGGHGWNESAGNFEGRDVKYNWRSTGFTQDDNHPVVNVTWNDAQKFCQWLSGKEGKTYRLPSEAQWEYACRAGTSAAWFHGDDPEGLAQVGNVADATAKAKWTNYPSFSYVNARDGYVFTAPVGTFRANSFGLYDMHGNVWEWCQDWYDGKYYDQLAGRLTEDPQGDNSEQKTRVLRGGSWGDYARGSRSASRSRSSPGYRYSYIGFRVSRIP